jgi:hypothetical protein
VASSYAPHDVASSYAPHRPADHIASHAALCLWRAAAFWVGPGASGRSSRAAAPCPSGQDGLRPYMSTPTRGS